MTTILFVHGIGVREPYYSNGFRLVEQRLKEVVGGAVVQRCYWGDAFGARLQADGKSIPEYVPSGGEQGLSSLEDRLLWSRLYHDPFFEMKALALRETPRLSLAPGQTPPAVVVRQQLVAYKPSKALLEMLEKHSLKESFGNALKYVLDSIELGDALKTVGLDGNPHRAVIARSIVAQTICEARGLALPTIDGRIRSGILGLFYDELDAQGKGVIDWLGRGIAQLAKRVASNMVQDQRGVLSDCAAPLAGDTLRYQARGEDLRSYIRSHIETCKPPVVLLAHSLGGVACFEILAANAARSVSALITVGSQAPLFYELDCLASMKFGEGLPSHFPKWLNIYDPQDFLSYKGEEVFGNKRVSDVIVDNGQPFPQSHSSYWANDVVWKVIARFLDRWLAKAE